MSSRLLAAPAGMAPRRRPHTGTHAPGAQHRRGAAGGSSPAGRALELAAA